MPPDDFFDCLNKLEQVIKKHGGAPSALTEVEIILRDGDVRREFFHSLDRADWIIPLHEAGYFADPPAKERVEGGGVRYPSWPPSRYLVRMAPQAASEVAGIFVGLDTDNSTIIGDMLDAALAMPTDCAAKLVPTVCRAAQAGTLWIHFSDASDLCVKLAKGGETEAAVMLADAIFTPQFESGKDEPARRDVYWYKEGLKKVIPLLASQQAGTFLPKLCSWLSATVEARKLRDTESDYSYVWRPAIEEHEQNKDYYFAGVMVGFVRDGLEYAIKSAHMTLDDALQLVSKHPHLVFKRIWIHLINVFANQNAQLARQVMMDRSLFNGFGYKHEYAMLMASRFNLLTPEERNTWLGWIDAGPSMDDVDSNADATLRQAQALLWQYEKLHWVRGHLEGTRKEFYERMLAEHGEPEMADLNFRMGDGRWGSDSPMAVQDLAALTFEQAMDRVASWKPDKPHPMGHDITGLASTFGEYVARNPEEFSKEARRLISQSAIFVRRFISKMAEAVKAGRSVDVAAVLDLCQWVLERPLEERTTSEQERVGLVDKDWQWTRDDISQFIEEVCKAKAGKMPRYPQEGLRTVMWQIISALSRGQSESYVVHETSKDDPRLRDYLDLGINSPRGKAVEAALEYARWVANHIKETKGEQELIPGGFGVMPEVKEMLQWQLEPETRTIEAMSVIGSRIGLLYWIDKAWLTQAADDLFNLRGIEQCPPSTHGWAAWNAFLVWVQPHIEFYRLFKSQFAYAVEQASQVELASSDSREQPIYHLGEHLMLLYGRGQLALEDDGGLLGRFLTEARPDIRRHAIGFVGQTLDRDEKLPPEVVKRFMALWEYYWANTGSADAKEKPGSWVFGHWFSCGQFPEQWSLDQMECFTTVDPTPEPDHAIAERLAEIAVVDIVKAARILDRVVRGDKEGWRIQGWLDSARQVVETAMKAGGEARSESIALINYLGRRGYTTFGELLRK